jgi:hypothetical protein
VHLGFYSELLTSGDINAAMNHLSGRFGVFLCERVFLRAFAEYIGEDCMQARAALPGLRGRPGGLFAGHHHGIVDDR